MRSRLVNILPIQKKSVFAATEGDHQSRPADTHTQTRHTHLDRHRDNNKCEMGVSHAASTPDLSMPSKSHSALQMKLKNTGRTVELQKRNGGCNRECFPPRKREPQDEQAAGRSAIRHQERALQSRRVQRKRQPSLRNTRKTSSSKCGAKATTD